MRRLGILVVAVAGLSCSDSKHNFCPNGCDLPGSTVVKWTFNAYPQWGFQSDSCSDFGLGLMVHIDMVKSDDPTVTASQDVQCSDGQATFSGLDPGTYNVSITPQDASGNNLVSSPATGSVPAADTNGTATVSVNVTYDKWTTAYTGEFLFQFTFDKKQCAQAVPAITTQLLTLSRGGIPIAVMTHNGMQAVDGTDPKPCESMFDYIENLPFGPVQFAITGKDATDVVRYTKQFDTFIGVGKFNPTITYDLPPPDAPPDTM